MSACVNIKVVWNINETVPLLTFVLLNLKLALVIVPHVRLKQRCVGLWTRWLGKTLPHLWQASSKLNSKSTLWSSAMDSTPRSSDAEQQSAPNTKNILWKIKKNIWYTKNICCEAKIFTSTDRLSCSSLGRWCCRSLCRLSRWRRSRTWSCLAWRPGTARPGSTPAGPPWTAPLPCPRLLKYKYK